MITKCQAVRDLYFKVKKQNPNLTIKQIVEIMMELPAPKFFCTYENALRFVSILHRGGDPKVKNPYKLAMYKALYAKWLEKHGAGVPKKKFVIFKDTLPGVIQSEAPSFYISKDTMVGFISRHDKRGGERCY